MTTTKFYHKRSQKQKHLKREDHPALEVLVTLNASCPEAQQVNVRLCDKRVIKLAFFPFSKTKVSVI